MIYLAIGLLFLLMLGSAYIYWRSWQETKQKQELFYSELLPYIEEAMIIEDRNSFPSLQGLYKNKKIKVIPQVDNLSLRRLPRLYAKIYIRIDNEKLCRIVKANEPKHLFTPAGFENRCMVLGEEGSEFNLFLAAEVQNGDVGYNNIAALLSGKENYAEILIQKNYIRATVMLAKGEKAHYAVLRAARFPLLALKYEHFHNTVELLFRLREEVIKIEQAS